MEVIQGEERARLEALLRQLRAHGIGGGSKHLSAAVSAVTGSQGWTMHGLAEHLVRRLLALEVRVLAASGLAIVGPPHAAIDHDPGADGGSCGAGGDGGGGR